MVMPWVGLPRLVLGGPHFALHAVWRASLGLNGFGLLGFGVPRFRWVWLRLGWMNLVKLGSGGYVGLSLVWANVGPADLRSV